MTPFEFVLVFLVGGVVILATMKDDRSLTNSVCTVLTVGLLHRLVATVKNCSRRLGAIFDGTPLLLIEDGQWVPEVMKTMTLEDDDVMAAARTKGYKSLSDIKYAVLERNGAISVIGTEK